ncbi:MAG: type II secretion system protein [Candidatus Omnitrophica bacterium]|nr:type II secretion system protein [Candidatus Omnitrophota bacterium]
MNTFRKKKSGFTLIELLIVIVILGILAALIVPRLIANTNRARNAEATNMLGAIRRAQLAQMDQAGVTTTTLANCGGTSSAQPTAACAGNPGWTALGLGTLPASRRFNYSCPQGPAATTLCTATKAPPTTGGLTRITMNVETGVIACVPASFAISDSTGVVACNG